MNRASDSPLRRARPPSLRRRLLMLLAAPLMALLLLGGILTYGIALSYSNHMHDKELSDDVLTLAQMFKRRSLDGELTPQARFLLEYDPDGHNYFSIVSRKRGFLGGNGDFPHATPPPEPKPVLYDTHLNQIPLRAASYSMASVEDPDDTLTVTIAETLGDRRQRARDILMMSIPLQSLLIVGSLLLTWFGVTRGLNVLKPLIRRLGEREQELEPIGDADVPQEILPLTGTIDDLFARLREAIAAQERFLADAAHQLRTPLAGLRLHAERALASNDPATTKQALEYIRQLTQRVSRTATQLLSVTRAQSQAAEHGVQRPLDLAQWVPEMVAQRVIEALHSGVDLGYAGDPGPLPVLGNPAALQEMLDNLIDNAMRYAGRGSSATVSVTALPSGEVELAMEDNGPGVPGELLPRLGERFFRVPGSREGGSGLGLSIVRQIAAQHHTRVSFDAGAGGGLRVSVRFPRAVKVG